MILVPSNKTLKLHSGSNKLASSASKENVSELNLLFYITMSTCLFRDIHQLKREKEREGKEGKEKERRHI